MKKQGFAQILIPVLVSAFITAGVFGLYSLFGQQYVSDIQLGAPTSTSQRSIVPTEDNIYSVGTTSPQRRFQSIHIGTGSSTFAGSIGIGTTTGGTGGQFLAIQGFGNLGSGTSTIVSGLIVPSITATSGIAITGGCYLQPNGTCLGAGGAVAGSDEQVQFNNSGSFGGALNLIYDNETDNVGIGTTAPGALLSVNGSILAQTGTSTFGGLISPSLFSTTSLGFYTAGTAAPRAVIDSNGNFGIGTTGPSAVLSINSGQLMIPDGTAAAPSYAFAADSGIGMFRSSTDVLGFSTAALERVRIAANGNVGIGATNPTGKLDVNGVLWVSGSTGFLGVRPRDGTGNNWGFYNPTGDSLIINSDSGDAVTVLNSGNVGIGQTNPKALLTVGNAIGTGDAIFGGDLFIYGGDINLGTGSATTTISGNGTGIGIGTTSPGSIFSVQGVGNFAVGTSTIFSGLQLPTLTATSGISVTGGSILATNIGATFGSTSVGGLTSANGVTLTAGCFKGPTGNCLGAAGGLPAGGTVGQVVTNTTSGDGTWQDNSFGILMCNVNGVQKQCRVITDVASGTIAITGIPARDFLEVKVHIPGLQGTTTPTLSFNGATTTNNIGGVIQDRGTDDIFGPTTTMPFHPPVAPSAKCGEWGCNFIGSIYGTSTSQKQITYTVTSFDKGVVGVSSPRMFFGQALYDNQTSAIHEIKLTCAQDGTKCDSGTEIIISGYRNAP